jgi:hypothetical protein
MIWHCQTHTVVKKKNDKQINGTIGKKDVPQWREVSNRGFPELCKDLVYTFCFLLGFSRLAYLKVKKKCVMIIYYQCCESGSVSRDPYVFVPLQVNFFK